MADSLYPSAKAEPELGGNTADVVATLEMTDITPIHELKLEPTEPPKIGPTVVALPQQQQQFGTGLDSPVVAMHLQQKIGAKCCGCCCDYRRAVIIVNSFFMGFAIFTMMVLHATPDLIDENFADDEFVDEVTPILDEYFLKRSIALGVAIFTAVLAIVGAVHFNTKLVGLHPIILVADYIAYIILALAMLKELEPIYNEKDIDPASPLPNFVFIGMLAILFIYPHVGFISEVRAGIMTNETYVREEYSCCCHKRVIAYQ